jgi:hypothetical protein
MRVKSSSFFCLPEGDPGKRIDSLNVPGQMLLVGAAAERRRCCRTSALLPNACFLGSPRRIATPDFNACPFAREGAGLTLNGCSSTRVP